MGKVDEKFEAVEKEIGEISESLQCWPGLEQAIEALKERRLKSCWHLVK